MCTGCLRQSLLRLSRYIYSAQKNICSIVEKVVASEQADVRFALVSYRDHPPQDSTCPRRASRGARFEEI